MSLLNSLKAHLAEHHEMSFMEFMQWALYAPNEGYYSSGLQKLGKHGDFITAPELTPLFGKTLANQCAQVFQAITAPNILEYGAGTGRLCVDILTRLEELKQLPEIYYIMEVSANLQHRQQELISQTLPHLAQRVQWLQRWPETPFNGVILANEVLDAMPVHRFKLCAEGLMESTIRLTPDQELEEYFKPCTDDRLRQYIESNLHIEAPYLSEVNLYIDDWIKNNFELLNQGMMLLIDYGFPRHEYYHPDRHQGTLMCHYQHRSHPNPLFLPGEQDLTAHVDFTHVAEAGHSAGFHVAGFTNQASFLLANGLLSFIHDLDTELAQFKAKQAIKQLTQPSEMGELFKVIALTKNLELDLTGFQLNDKRVTL